MGLIATGGQAEHWSVGGEQLVCASLISLGFYFSFSLLFIIILVVVTTSIINGTKMFYFASII